MTRKLVVCIWDNWEAIRPDECELTSHKPVKDVVYQVREEFSCGSNVFYKLAELVNPPVYNHILKSLGEPSFDAWIFREVRLAEPKASQVSKGLTL